MSDREDRQERPRLSVVKDAEEPSLPPLPASPPDSAQRRELRGRVAAWGDAFPEAARLCALGIVLARGAEDLRPGMSARSAAAWLDRHAEDVERDGYAAMRGGTRAYGGVDDLREAVLGAAAELDEAAMSSGKTNLAAAVYLAALRVTEKSGEPSRFSEQLLALYDYGSAVLAESGLAVIASTGTAPLP